MFDEEKKDLQEISHTGSLYESSSDNTTDSSASDGSDYRYSRSYYKSPYEDTSYTYSGSSTGSYGGDGNGPKKKKSSYVKKLAVVASLAIVGGSLAGASFEAVRYLAGDQKTQEIQEAALQEEEQTRESSSDTAGNTISQNENSLTEPTPLINTVTDVSGVVESVMPSVVSITNIGKTEIQVPDFFGRGGDVYEQEQESSGSGIIIGENETEILIATNNHVVANATTLSVCFVDDSVVEAKIKGTDADTDLAIIAVKLEDIEGETKNKIKVAQLGDSDSLKVGEAAIAIGNALGYGQSVTTGVISAVNREVTVDSVTSELIQTDAAINPGNSGGALLNMKGEVIGINSVKFSSTEVEGMGYAIPITAAQPIFEELAMRQTRDRVDSADTGYLGIAGVDVSGEASSIYDMPAGVYVAQVTEGSAAESAGMKKGDIITQFDGRKVNSMSDLQDILQYYEAGSTIDVKVQTADNGQYVEKVLSVTLGRKLQ